MIGKFKLSNWPVRTCMRAPFYWITADFFVPADNVHVGWGKTGVNNGSSIKKREIMLFYT